MSTVNVDSQTFNPLQLLGATSELLKEKSRWKIHKIYVVPTDQNRPEAQGGTSLLEAYVSVCLRL